MSSEIKIRLLQPLRVNGILWAKGLVIGLPADKARQLVRLGVAERTEETEREGRMVR